MISRAQAGLQQPSPLTHTTPSGLAQCAVNNCSWLKSEQRYEVTAASTEATPSFPVREGNAQASVWGNFSNFKSGERMHLK